MACQASSGENGVALSPPIALPASLSVWEPQAKEDSRVSVVPSPGRPGQSALRLLVLPGDTNVAGSGPDGDRTDAMVGATTTGGVEGREQWWSWSTYFPSDYNPTPSTAWNGFLDFHNTGSSTMANVAFEADSHFDPPRLEMSVYGGAAPAKQRLFRIGRLRREQWYDFILHVVWSSNPRRGLVELFLSGRPIVGPVRTATLYSGEGVYLKLSNYRLAGPMPSAILHAGVRRSTSYADAVNGFASVAGWARRLELHAGTASPAPTAAPGRTAGATG
jgi:hypothetical protein